MFGVLKHSNKGNKVKFIILALLLTGCSGGGEWSVITTPSPEQIAIQQELSEYNAFRVASGQTILTQGLSCRLATVPVNSLAITGTTQTTVGSYTYNGTFNIPNQPTSNGINILPAVLQPLYTQWYVVTCTGFMVFPDSDWHSFALTSDDGSLLAVNGALINNDGNHGAITVNGTRFFQQGVYAFTLQYMQATGNEALILQMDGQVVDSDQFAH